MTAGQKVTIYISATAFTILMFCIYQNGENLTEKRTEVENKCAKTEMVYMAHNSFPRPIYDCTGIDLNDFR